MKTYEEKVVHISYLFIQYFKFSTEYSHSHIVKSILLKSYNDFLPQC